MELILRALRTRTHFVYKLKSRSTEMRNGSFNVQKNQAQARLRRTRSAVSPRSPSVAVAGSGMDKSMPCVSR